MTLSMDRPIAKTLWRRPGPQRALIAGAVVITAMLAAVVALNPPKATLRIARDKVTIEAVRAGVFHDDVILRAKVAPRDVIYLDALEGGQVKRVLAHAGDRVTEGQPLVEFTNTTLELEVLNQEARLVESITQLQTRENQLEDARVANERAVANIEYEIVRLSRTAERRDALAAQGFATREQQQAVHDELAHNRRLLPLQQGATRDQEALRKRQLPQIRSELVSLQESLKITRSKLDSLVLRAPVAGRLADMDLKVGEIRNRGQRLGQVVADTGFKLAAQIDEYYLARVRVGLPGRVESGGKAYPVRLIRFDPQVKDSVFAAELEFTGATPPDLLTGQALEGRLTLGGDQPALILPAGAFLERTGGDWAMVVDRSEKTAERRRIRIGRRSTEQLEVLGGLRAGEQVITSDYEGFDKIERVVLTQ